MNSIICYFNSNYIDIKKNKEEKRIVSSAIRDGDIVNKDVFIKDIKKTKFFSNILTNNVIIYLNHLIEEKDQIYYKFVFEDLNCNIIKIFDTSKMLISPTLINSNNIYILFYKNKYYKIIPELLNDYINLYNIEELKIISKNKISCKSNARYYYYNYKNENFTK